MIKWLPSASNSLGQVQQTWLDARDIRRGELVTLKGPSGQVLISPSHTQYVDGAAFNQVDGDLIDFVPEDNLAVCVKANTVQDILPNFAGSLEEFGPMLCSLWFAGERQKIQSTALGELSGPFY